MMRHPDDLPARPDTLVDVLRWRAELHPDRPWFTFLRTGEVDGPRDTRTFGEIRDRAHTIATHLAARGLAGEPVLLLYPPGVHYVDAFLGCLLAGVIAVPAYPPDPSRLERTLPRLTALVADAGATTALATGPIAQLAAAVGGPALSSLDWLATDALLSPASPSNPLPAPRPNDLAFLQYTSGSTGDPRGVMLTHANLIANEAVIYEQAGPIAPGVGWLPPYHDMGLIGMVLQPLFAGTHTVLMSPLDFLKRPVRWLQAISAFRGAQNAAPEFAFSLLNRRVTDRELQGLDLSSWRICWNGAEPIRPETIETFEARLAPYGLRPGVLRPCYGLAEATLMATRSTSEDRSFPEVDVAALDRGRLKPGAGRRLCAVGTPAPGHAVRIVDPESLRPTEEGAIGEVWVQGPSTAAGYWKRPEETRATFGATLPGTDGSWLRTGDLGAVDASGQLVVTGRHKDLLILNGRNLFPHDIEATAAAAHPRIRAGSVAAFEAEAVSGPTLVVVAEVDQRGDAPDPEQVIDAVVEAVDKAHDVAAGAIVLLPYGELPKTTSGKVRRQPTRSAWLAGELPIVASRQRPDVDGPVYAGLPGRAARPDRRKTHYQFDLHADIAWEQADEPGIYVTRGMAEALDLDLDAATAAGAMDTVQWTVARALCRSFSLLEKSLIAFMDRERAWLGTHRSLDLLHEEELKHIALMDRIEEHLVRQRPDLARVFDRYADAIEQAVALDAEPGHGATRAETHCRLWMNLLFFEDWTIWLSDALRAEADQVQPMWLSAHVAHAREEVQHTVTDRVYLDALCADEAQQRAWARASLLDVARPQAAVAAVVHEVCAALHDGFSPRRFSDESRLIALLKQRGFKRVRAQVPFFDELVRSSEQPTTRSVLLGAPARAHTPSRDALVDFLQSRVADLLGRDVAELCTRASLASLGVDSAVRISLAGELERHLGCEVSTTIAYDHPSIEAIADAVLGAANALPPSTASGCPDLPTDLASTRQARLLRLHRTHGGEALRDHLLVGGRLSGDPDEDTLAAALSELVQRHPGLRTTFTLAEDGTVRTVVHDSAAVTLRQIEAEDARTAARRLARRLDGRTYDPARGPLLRAALVRDETSAFVVLAAHHLIADSWSLDVLLRDWLALYRARVHATGAELPDLGPTPRDLAVEEAAGLASPEGRRRLEHWRRHLADHPIVQGPPPDLAFTGASTSRHLGPESLEALRAWAACHDESPFAVLLGAVHLHQHRTEGLQDALVGTHRHRRDRPDLRDLVDYRVDVLPLRTDLTDCADLTDAVARVRRSWVQALANAVPIDAIVEHVAPHHAPARSLLAPLAVNWIPFGYRADDPDFTYDSTLVPPPGLLFFERMLLAQPRGRGLDLVLWSNAETVSSDAAGAFLDGVLALLPLPTHKLRTKPTSVSTVASSRASAPS